MELQYELNRGDYEQYWNHVARLVKKTRTPWSVRLVAPVAGAIVAVALMLTRPSERVVADAIIVFGAACFLTLTVFWTGKSKATRFRQAFLGTAPDKLNVSLALSPDGATLHTGLGSESLLWRGIAGLEQSDTHLFMRTGFDDIRIIPKRAFRDERHMSEFLDEMARLKAAAAGAEPDVENSGDVSRRGAEPAE